MYIFVKYVIRLSEICSFRNKTFRIYKKTFNLLLTRFSDKISIECVNYANSSESQLR